MKKLFIFVLALTLGGCVWVPYQPYPGYYHGHYYGGYYHYNRHHRY